MALTSCCQPVTGELMFEIGEDEMEIGMGVHGEAGTGRMALLSADATVDLMLPPLLEDLPFQSGDEVCVLINNSGSMTLMELSILYRRVQQTPRPAADSCAPSLAGRVRHNPGDGRLWPFAMPRRRSTQSVVRCSGQWRCLQEFGELAMSDEAHIDGVRMGGHDDRRRRDNC